MHTRNIKFRKMPASFILGTLALLFAIPAFADSEARIVRLSNLEGDVQIDRAGEQGFEKAVMNLPITQGTKLRAGYDGFAEIEFEDGSTVRITPGAGIEIPRLVLRDSGAKATTVNVLDGTVYLSYQGSKDDDFLLAFGDQKLSLVKSGHIRLEMGPSKARLSILNGATVQVERPSETVAIAKKKAVTFAMDGQTPPAPPDGVTKMQYDAWDQRQDQYHDRYARNSSYRDPSYIFGLSDLNYFGSFYHSPVCGLVWRPYLVSAAWSPFQNGDWFLFPKYGYSWVSPYPWGWMPYHYGSWQMCPNYGWAWQPGGTWLGVNNIPKCPARGHCPIYPSPRQEPVRPKPPVKQALSPIPAPITRLALRDNAGLGIPRGSIPNLRSLSRQVEQHGPVNVFVYNAPGAVHQTRIVPANVGTNSTWRQGSGSVHTSGTYSHPSSGATPPTGSYSHPSSGATSSSPAAAPASSPASGGTRTPK